LLDLDLVGALGNLEGVCVVVLLEKGSLLGHANGIDDLVNVSHDCVRLGGAISEGFKSVIKDNDSITMKDLLDVDGLGGLQKSGLNVPGGIVGSISEFSTDDEDFLGVGQCLKRGDEILGLAGLYIERSSAKDRSIVNLVTKDALQSESADFLGNGLGVGTIARAEGDTTTNKDRGFAITVTGVTGAFLAIHLLAGSVDFSTGLGLSGSRTAVGLVGNDEVVHSLASLGLVGDQLNIGALSVLDCEC
jgi:hypothetical protein